MKGKGLHLFHLPQTQQEYCINLYLFQLMMDADIPGPKKNCDNNGRDGKKRKQNNTPTKKKETHTPQKTDTHQKKGQKTS